MIIVIGPQEAVQQQASSALPSVFRVQLSVPQLVGAAPAAYLQWT